MITPRSRSKAWLDGRVPNGYWDDIENRRNYMRWLGKTLGYRRPEDWYNITKHDFHSNCGGGLLANYYRDSAQAAVIDYMPDYDWKTWLFRSVPQGFWRDPQNRRAFMAWLGEQLEIRQPEDWYRVTQSDFHTYGGGGLLANYYRDSPQLAVAEFLPKHDWKTWLFRSVPQGFWRKPENRRVYMNWLGEQLGFRDEEDWYQLRCEDFIRHRGQSLLASYYSGSPFRALRDYRPDYGWEAGKMESAPRTSHSA